MNLLFDLSLAGYLAALLLALADLWRSRRTPASIKSAAPDFGFQISDFGFRLSAFSFLVFASSCQTAWLALRWASAGRPPFSNLFESLALFAWTTVIVHLALHWRRRIRIPALSVATPLFALLLIGAALALDSRIVPLPPALRSRWLCAHVLACILAYGALAVAALASATRLIIELPGFRSFSEGSRPLLDAAAARSITFGFLLLTIGIIAGAVWANSAWGTYWSWDPKETWALITWLIYAAYLHGRRSSGWTPTRAAWLSMLGFASVLFTYLGVTFLMSGMHGYAR